MFERWHMHWACRGGASAGAGAGAGAGARAHTHTHARTHAHTHTGLFWNYTRSLLTLYQVSFDTALVSSDTIPGLF